MLSYMQVEITRLPLCRILVQWVKAKCWEGAVLQKKKGFLFFSFFFLILFGTFCLMRESCVNVGQVEVGMRRLRDAHGTLFRLICRLSQILSCYM